MADNPDGKPEGVLPQPDDAGLCIILCTAPDDACARAIAQRLLAGNLAACVTLLPGATSLYCDFDFISDLERKYNDLISVADAMNSICDKLGCHQGIAAELILSHLPEECDVMGKPANALFFGKRVGLATFKYYENAPSIRVMLMRAIEKDITMLKKELTQEYKDFVFIKADLEECLGFTFDNPAEFRADLEFHSDSDQNKISESLEPFKVIQSLKIENEKLKQELAATKLKLPLFLGAYRDDDPLLLAIQLRNVEWRHYDEHDRRTIPAQTALVAQLQEKYGKEQMPEVQAKAIEKVACPIKR